MLHLHIARVYLMPDSFNGLNYAWRIITCEALIFNWSKFYVGEEGGGVTQPSDCPRLKNKHQRGKMLIFPRLNFSLCLLRRRHQDRTSPQRQPG